MTRVGIYVRISDDRDGTQQATKRQLEDCRRFAASKGWHVADVFEDVDVSAYQRTAKRPEFERMIQAVNEKDIDGVLAWKMDRISRRQRDLVRLDEQCETSGAFIATVIEAIDTRQSTGRFVAELLVAQARMESSNTSVRVKRAHEAQAKAGRPALGGLRPYGYTIDHGQIVPKEAALIREAAERVLNGESVRGILLDWEQRGVVTSTGKAWKDRPLRRTLMNAMLSGQREYEGTLTKGKWPAILTPEETTRLRAVFTGSGRSKVRRRKHLLSGILRCGRCDSPLFARPTMTGVRRYVCARQPGLPNCGKLARVAEPIEEVVRDAVFEALEGVDLAEYMKADGGNGINFVEIISECETRLEELSKAHFADKLIERNEYFAARRTLQERLEQARTQLAQETGRKAIAGAIHAGAELAGQWDTRPLEWQRAVIDALIDHIVIQPAVKGSRTFDPALVQPVWRA